MSSSYQKPWGPEGNGTTFLSAERKELSMKNCVPSKNIFQE